MLVAITGASGLIGRCLQERLRAQGDDVVRFVRRAPILPDEVQWDPTGARAMPVETLESVDAVVHLAGEGVAAKRWTEKQKHRILDSRRTGTRVLAEAIAAATPRPSVLVSGSAVGYYGTTGDRVTDEGAASGDDFLSDVCRQWEAATGAAERAGVRVVRLRSGIVQSKNGGALKRQLLPFRLGLGGRIGDGHQWVSWISLDDEVGAIIHCLRAPELRGPVNATSPNPVTNIEYTKALGRALHRPTVVPIPVQGLALLMGAELVSSLLTSQRVVPEALLRSGYRFEHPTIDEGLQTALAR